MEEKPLIDYNKDRKDLQIDRESDDFCMWAEEQGIKLVAEQIPIGNLVDLENNLFEYRKVLYRNSRDNNRAKIILH